MLRRTSNYLACWSSSGDLTIQELPQGDDTNLFVLSEIEHRSIAGDDQIRTACNGAFQKTIVWVIGQYCDANGWLDELAEIPQEHCESGQLLRLIAELPRHHLEKLIESLVRDDELIFAAE